MISCAQMNTRWFRLNLKNPVGEVFRIRLFPSVAAMGIFRRL